MNDTHDESPPAEADEDAIIAAAKARYAAMPEPKGQFEGSVAKKMVKAYLDAVDKDIRAGEILSEQDLVNLMVATEMEKHLEVLSKRLTSFDYSCRIEIPLSLAAEMAVLAFEERTAVYGGNYGGYGHGGYEGGGWSSYSKPKPKDLMRSAVEAETTAIKGGGSILDELGDDDDDLPGDMPGGLVG